MKETVKDNAEKVLEIFYRELNGIIAVFFVIFILSFILSRALVEIVFGSAYIPDHSSLPFVLLANMALAISLVVYTTARRINRAATINIIKLYSIVFVPIFIFLSINYIDTVAFFIIGSATLLSVFLYNFAMRNLDYISDTYNHFF